MINLKNAVRVAVAAALASGCELGFVGDSTTGATSTGGNAGGSSNEGGNPNGGSAPNGGGSPNGGGGFGGTATSGGGFGGSGGAGGSGGSGGASACLDGSSFADLFTVKGTDLCPVAVYTAAQKYDFHLVSTSFGSHGGPLFVEAGANQGDVDLKRWTPPAGATGSFTIGTTTAPAQIPAGAFLGAQALDLGFFGWTAIAYSGPTDTTGEIILLSGASVATSYPVNGPFAFGSVVDNTDSGRLIYSGLSALDDATDDTNGLFAADSCGTSTMSPSLEPGTNATCTAPSKIDAWDEASGPVAVDTLGNAFAVLANFSSGDQEARGYTKTQIGRGAAPVTGTTLFSLPGFGTSLAAVSPTSSNDGILAFQPSDSTSFEALDVVGQKYNVAGGVITVTGTPAQLLQLTAEDTALAMTTDPKGRLWVGASRSDGTTVFVVLARP